MNLYRGVIVLLYDDDIVFEFEAENHKQAIKILGARTMGRDYVQTTKLYQIGTQIK